MPKPLPDLKLTENEKQQLLSIVNKRKAARDIVLRAKIVLLASEFKSTKEIMTTLSTTKSTVVKWRKRFVAKRLDGLADEPRSGRKSTYSQQVYNELLAKTLQEPEGLTHWTTREMAKQMNVSHMTVYRAWQKNNIKPHLSETFKYSNDPLLEEKIIDVVGLYLNPPENAIVLSVDEKSSIQALDRTQPLLPMKPHQIERRTHDYKRHGTTTLFAAFDTIHGNIIGKCYRRHRHQEFLGFLKEIKKNVPPRKKIHIILDNYSTHKHEKVKNWLKRNKRFTFHFTPTSASWMNQVETWFGILHNKQLKRGIFRSVKDLAQKITDFIERYNTTCKPFKWIKTADEILEKAKRFNYLSYGTL